MVSCGRCSVSHTEFHDTAFLPGNFSAGTDERISALESPFVLANTPKALHLLLREVVLIVLERFSTQLFQSF